MKKSNRLYKFFYSKLSWVSSSGFILLLGLSLITFSCRNEKVESTEVIVPINNIHINLLSWDTAVSQEDGIYLYNGQVYTGQLNNSRLNYKVKATAQLVEGLLHGYLKEVYADGQRRTMKSYHKGYELGPQEGWHSNGKLSYSYIADNGKKNGIYQEYYPNGNLQVESFYADGMETKRKVKDVEGDIIVNYEIRNGRYYGLLGSSSCITVFEDKLYNKSYEE